MLCAETINELLPLLQAIATAPIDFETFPAALEAAAPYVRSDVLEPLEAAAIRRQVQRPMRLRPVAARTPRPGQSQGSAPKGATPAAASTAATAGLWQRLQLSLVTPVRPTIVSADAGGGSASGGAIRHGGAATSASLLRYDAGVATPSPEAAGPGQAARSVTSTAAFREFATPTPVKRRLAERDGSPGRELADLSAARSQVRSSIRRARPTECSAGMDDDENVSGLADDSPAQPKRARKLP